MKHSFFIDQQCKYLYPYYIICYVTVMFILVFGVHFLNYYLLLM